MTETKKMMTDEDLLQKAIDIWKETLPEMRGRIVCVIATMASKDQRAADEYAALRSDSVDAYRDRLVVNADSGRAAAALLDLIARTNVTVVR